MNQMNSSLVDVWLENSANNSTAVGMGASSSDQHNGVRRKKKRGGKKRPSQYYRDKSSGGRTCCQDLVCSKLTIFFLIAALLGALVAWKTGAFYKQDADTGSVPNATTTVPIDLNSNSNSTNPVVWDKHHDKEGSIMGELKDLLIQLGVVHQPELLEPTEPLSPQCLALHCYI